MNDFQIDYVEWPADPEFPDLLLSGSPDLKHLARALDFETVTQNMDELRHAADETTRAFIEYIEADREALSRLYEQYSWIWWSEPRRGRAMERQAIVAQRVPGPTVRLPGGQRILGYWLDEWSDWQFQEMTSTVTINGITMPRIIPMKKEIELPHFDIREQRGEKEKIRKGVIRSFNQPVAKKSRRRDGGVSPWETKRCQIRSRSNLKT